MEHFHQSLSSGKCENEKEKARNSLGYLVVCDACITIGSTQNASQGDDQLVVASFFQTNFSITFAGWAAAAWARDLLF